jgi:hypothetical protein
VDRTNDRGRQRAGGEREPCARLVGVSVRIRVVTAVMRFR